MRQLLIEVPRGEGAAVVEAARRRDATNLAVFQGDNGESPVDLLFVHLPNEKIEDLLRDLQSVEGLHVSLIPQGVLALRPPPGEAPEQAVDVGIRSPIEIFLAGLQSVGSWRAFLGYSVAAGATVWIGLFTNTIYLLVAAMLIAPFAGPAMNTAVATARGDSHLLRRTLARYFASLGVTIATAAALSWLFQLRSATPLMVETSQISIAAVLLPLVAGSAGALYLIQSERSSLVSGAAVGMLVAASLAPPAGLAGMAPVAGRWEMAGSGIFLLLLQLAGINLSGAVIFRLAGLTPVGARYDRGRNRVFLISLSVTALALAALLVVQRASSPALQRASVSQRAIDYIRDEVNRSGLARPVEVNSRFTRPDVEGEEMLLVELYVQRMESVEVPDREVRQELTRRIQRRLRNEGFAVTALVSVTVLDPPGHQAAHLANGSAARNN